MGSIAVIFEWIGLFMGAGIAGALLGLLTVRWRLVRRVRSELGREKVLLVTNSRVAFIQEGRRSGRLAQGGILMLLKSGLYYHSWLSRREIFVPGAAITYIGVSDGTNGHAAYKGAVVLHFLNTLGKEDEVIIKLFSPDQWVTAIKTHLIARPV